jgi:hypothetical protein
MKENRSSCSRQVSRTAESLRSWTDLAPLVIERPIVDDWKPCVSLEIRTVLNKGRAYSFGNRVISSSINIHF